MSKGKSGKNNKDAFMALRNNVQNTKLELWHRVTGLEYYIVEIIIDKTIKWRVEEAKINIEDFVEISKARKDYIYAALKTLEEMGVIKRRKVNHNWIIGLNPDYFGQLLIEVHAEKIKERKNKIKVIVDNSKNHVDNFEEQTKKQSSLDLNSVQSRLKNSLSDTEKQSHKQGENVEIIEENRSLNTLLKDININTFLKNRKNQNGNGESFTHFGEENGNEKQIPHATTSDEIEAERKRQVRAMDEYLAKASGDGK